jgi:hypothetical protein
MGHCMGLRYAQGRAAGICQRNVRQNCWDVTFADHAYVQKRDDLKRQQLAKAGARLAHILNKVWP